jgi:hypothetical protein
MARRGTLDDFLSQKEGPLRVFVFLLNDEYKIVDLDNHWFNHSLYHTTVIRLTEEEFHMLDMARHPKILVTKHGKELFQINGIPDPEVFERKMKGII